MTAVDDGEGIRRRMNELEYERYYTRWMKGALDRLREKHTDQEIDAMNLDWQEGYIEWCESEGYEAELAKGTLSHSRADGSEFPDLTADE